MPPPCCSSASHSLIETGLARGAQEPFAHADEGNDQQNLRGRHGGLDELNCRQIQAKRERDRRAQNARDAEDGHVADHHSDGHAQRQSIRRYSLAQ